MVSWFYYERAGWKIVKDLKDYSEHKLLSELKKSMYDVEYLKMDFNQCVRKGMYIDL